MVTSGRSSGGRSTPEAPRPSIEYLYAGSPEAKYGILFDNDTQTLANKFIQKYHELEEKDAKAREGGEETEEINLFRATVEVLALEGNDLLNPGKEDKAVTDEEMEKADSLIKEVAKKSHPRIQRPSLRQIFQRESEEEDDKS